MIKKIMLGLLALVLIITVASGISYRRQTGKTEKMRQADEAAAKTVVEDFGLVLKNISLLSETAAREIEANYKDFVAPELLREWQDNPHKALGRLASSPWPERIEVEDMEIVASGSAYGVNGNLVEATSTGETKRQITLYVMKIDGRWLITGTNDFSAINDPADIAAQLRECLPKSDTGSRDKCEELLGGINNFDECVVAGFPALKSNPAQCQTPDGRTFVQKTSSTWEMAVLAINRCEVEKVFQTHDKIVTLELKNGGELTAAEPRIDLVFDQVRQAAQDCGEIIMATE